MLRNNRHSTKMDTTCGVSEVVGVILLISLVVIAVAIMGVFLFSQQTPTKIPNINFMTGSDGNGNLLLFHNGGDSLTNGTFSVTVDQLPKSYTLSDSGNVWSLGKTLIVTGVSTGPHTVKIIYNGTGSSGGVLLRTASANVSMSTAGISPDIPPSVTPVPSCNNCTNCTDPEVILQNVLSNVSIIGDAMNQSPSTVGPVIANVVGANSINFYREQKTTIDQYTYFVFTITTTDSTFSYGNTAVKNLGFGDTVQVRVAKTNPGNWKIFGLGDKMWEFTAVDVDVNWRQNSTGLWTNTSSTTLYHSWITGYKDAGSTLTLRTTQNGYYTALAINGTVLIDGISSNSIEIKNIRPVGIGLYVLQYDLNTNGVYFIGNAQSVTW